MWASIARNEGARIRELSVTFPAARKLHRCTICWGWIAVGEEYCRLVYVDREAIGSQFRCSRIHKRCPTVLGGAA